MQVCFAHGMESGPWGRKITVLAAVAKSAGFAVESIDFTATRDPEQRVAMMLEQCPRGDSPLVFVGSSMGGYVVARAAETCPVTGLFLMAPAIGIAGYPGNINPQTVEHEVVHGWHDDIVPVDAAITHARRHGARLHILDTGHDLNDRIPTIEELFRAHLSRVINGDAADS